MIKAFIYDIIHLLRTKEKVPVLIPQEEAKVFENQVALISGGSGGIGKAIAYELLHSGCKVILTGTNKMKLAEIEEELSSKEVITMMLDVADVKSFEDKIEEAWNAFGTGKIDILINCAGINDSKPFLEVTEDVYDRIMDVNTKGTYFLSQTIAKKMIKNKVHGHILNISSASALRPASTPYILSKCAISGMTKGMADVLIKYGIVVNAIAPGPVATQMVGKENTDEISHASSPAGRYALPCEIAHLAAYMVSGYGDLIVGDTFYITGGSGTISLHK